MEVVVDGWKASGLRDGCAWWEIQKRGGREGGTVDEPMLRSHQVIFRASWGNYMEPMSVSKERVGDRLDNDSAAPTHVQALPSVHWSAGSRHTGKVLTTRPRPPGSGND